MKLVGMRKLGWYASFAIVVGLAVAGATACSGSVDMNGPITDPPFTGKTGTILFVTQVPASGFVAVTAVLGNHRGSIEAAPRGGDLMIRYPDGTLRNLTREAGFGMTGLQGDNAIAVREPAVHWSGNKAVFSMVVGAPRAFEQNVYHWQLYEIAGLGAGETAVITKIPNQPEDYNNVSPTYATDDEIIFASDRPRNGETHLYPQLDEYESSPTVTGLWRLDPASGKLEIIEHAPSGVFSPSVDSAGRVVFTKWDHLQRDQQADAERATPGRYGVYTASDESAGATRTTELNGVEVFPESRGENDPNADPNVNGHRFNQFFPWEINEDGSAEETLNHVGRHEIGGSYVQGSFKDDPNLVETILQSTHANRYSVGGDGGMFQMREDPRNPGTFYATHAHEFGTAGGGAIIKMVGGIDVNPDDMVITEVTSRACAVVADDPNQAPDSTGHYRNAIPMSDGMIIASHTADKGSVKNDGSRALPNLNFEYRLTVLVQDGTTFKPGGVLTSGISADISWYDPDVLVTYKGLLWELDGVEVAPRERPVARGQVIDTPEMTVFTETGVDLAKLRAWLAERDLALIISRNVTHRDRADLQQPFNLRVPGGAETIAKDGIVYDISFFQIFEGDSLRGYGGIDSNRGLRLLARPIHGPDLPAPPAGGPEASVALGLDGSMAAFVPARRALSWQLTDPTGKPVVRERNWISFAPGEIRTCAVCHGINKQDQVGKAVPTNPPEALRTLMQSWVSANP